MLPERLGSGASQAACFAAQRNCAWGGCRFVGAARENGANQSQMRLPEKLINYIRPLKYEKTSILPDLKTLFNYIGHLI